jgi:hypothetical protein
MIMTSDPDPCALPAETADLLAQLNGLIFLGRVAWQLSPERLPHMARIFHFVGETDQTAARNRQAGQPVHVRINYKDICQ